MNIAYHTLTWANFYKDFDLDRVLTDISKAGFKGVEFAEKVSLLGPPSKLKSKLKNFNLSLVSLSCGFSMNKVDTADIKETNEKIDYAREFGVKSMMVCGGWLKEKRPKIEDDFKILAEKLEICALYAGSFNMYMAYHPHKDTIVETNEDIDRLLEYTKLTKLCIDIAHISSCESDPAKVIEKHKKKIVYVHLKDWSKSLNSFVELGQGEVRILESIVALNRIKYNGWMTVELDNTNKDPFTSAKISAEFLKRNRLL